MYTPHGTRPRCRHSLTLPTSHRCCALISLDAELDLGNRQIALDDQPFAVDGNTPLRHYHFSVLRSTGRIHLDQPVQRPVLNLPKPLFSLPPAPATKQPAPPAIIVRPANTDDEDPRSFWESLMPQPATPHTKSNLPKPPALTDGKTTPVPAAPRKCSDLWSLAAATIEEMLNTHKHYLGNKQAETVTFSGGS